MGLKMPKSVISEGKTTTEAIDNGLKILKVSKDKVEIKVLETEKKSFFSILTPRVVKVELKVKEDVMPKVIERKPIEKTEKMLPSEENLEKARKNLENFLKAFIPTISSNIKYSIEKMEYGFDVCINGENTGTLIGYRGEALNSLQVILNAIANKGIEERIKVLLDIEGYREKRKKTLEDLAEKLSKTVIRTGKSITLEPMQAYERKIIHSVLQNNSKITTYSIGEEPYRKIVISLNKNK